MQAQLSYIKIVPYVSVTIEYVVLKEKETNVNKPKKIHINNKNCHIDHLKLYPASSLEFGVKPLEILVHGTCLHIHLKTHRK